MPRDNRLSSPSLRREEVTFQNLKDCAAAHKELLEENRTLQAQLAAAEALLREVIQRGKSGQSDLTMCCDGDEAYELRKRIEKWLAAEPRKEGE